MADFAPTGSVPLVDFAPTGSVPAAGLCPPCVRAKNQVVRKFILNITVLVEILHKFGLKITFYSKYPRTT